MGSCVRTSGVSVCVCVCIQGGRFWRKLGPHHSHLRQESVISLFLLSNGPNLQPSLGQPGKCQFAHDICKLHIYE